MKRQRGVALLIILLIVALVSVLATDMGARLQLQIARVTNIKDANQAYWYAMGAEHFARKSIQQVMELDNGVVSLSQPWAQEIAYPLEGGGIEAELKDLQSCFNINALQDNREPGASGDEAENEAIQAFHLLLQRLPANIPSFEADTFRDSVADWLDNDGNLRPYGAEDSDYESLEHPYLAANALMVNKTELRMVNGANMEWLPALLPVVCAIPSTTELQININTLTEDTAAVLAAVTGLSLEDAKNQIRSRPVDGYDDIADFYAQPEIQALQLSDTRRNWLVTSTEHFILTTKTRYNNASFVMSSVFKVGEDNQVSVIRREFGGVY
nr:type II secretion system minor pseudopilin GspK [Aestuariibacter salexigens]